MKKIICPLIFALISLFSNYSIAFQSGKMPASLDEMIDNSIIIIIGDIGEIVSKGYFYGYQKNAESLGELDKLSNIQFGIPYVDYKLIIKKILMDDNYLINDKFVTYRVLQSHRESNYNDKTLKGKSSMFFLSKTPKGQFGIQHPMNRLNLNNEIPVTYFYGKKEYIPHTMKELQNISSNDVINKVKLKIKNK